MAIFQFTRGYLLKIIIALTGSNPKKYLGKKHVSFECRDKNHYDIRKDAAVGKMKTQNSARLNVSLGGKTVQVWTWLVGFKS
jgi:hypothetical protein